MTQINYALLQPHTIELYNLKEKKCSIERVKARSLLHPQRFDLFAKLFYIRSKDADNDKAISVYQEHIKAFNPDGREPGRDDKNSFEDFLQTFDKIIKNFESGGFDESVSIVPVTKDGVILDGAHRIAALAYYDKDVTIARFDDVLPVCQFNYAYFKQRGLSQEICDVIANEILLWTPHCFVACLWPKIGSANKKQIAIGQLEENTTVFYRKTTHCTLSSLGTFIAKVYQKQPS